MQAALSAPARAAVAAQEPHLEPNLRAFTGHEAVDPGRVCSPGQGGARQVSPIRVRTGRKILLRWAAPLPDLVLFYHLRPGAKAAMWPIAQNGILASMAGHAMSAEKDMLTYRDAA